MRKTKIELVENLIGKSIFDFGIEHNYNKDFFDLFVKRAKNTEVKSAFLKSKADRRSLEEYHRDVALGWIIEDYLVDISKGKLSLYGCDSDREFLVKGITNCGDLVDNNGTIYEVVCDFQSVKYGNVNLRQNKLMHLREQNAKIILVDVVNKRTLIRAAKDFPFYKIEKFAPYGGKSAYRIFFDKFMSQFRPLPT